MNKGSVVDPRLMATVTPAAFPTLATFQQPTASVDAYGVTNLNASVYVNVTGYVDLPARFSPQGFKTVKGGSQEAKLADMITETDHMIVELAGSYPAIDLRWRVLVNGTALDVVGVDADGQSSITRVTVQRRAN